MRKTLRPAVAAGLTMTLAACGGASSDGSSSATSTTTSSASSAVGSSTAAPTGTTPQSTGPTPGAKIDAVAWVKEVRASYEAAKSFKMSGVKSTESGTSTAQVQRKASGPADFQATMPGGGEMRGVDGEVYLQVPDLPGKWIRFAKTSTDPDVKEFLEQAHGADSIDGSGELDVYAAGTVTYVGEEAGGNHYKVVAPATKFYEHEVGKDATTETERPVNRNADLAKLKSKTVTYDVWLDSGRLAKVKSDSTDLSGIELSAKISEVVYTSTTTFSDWDVPVKVAAPPAASVVMAEAVK